MIKYVGFDKDGTLINDFDGYTKEWGKIIQSDFGIDSKDAEEVFTKLAGQPTDIQLAEVLKNSNINLPQSEMFQKAEEIAEVLGKRVRGNPFPEVIEVLRKLKKNGYSIFVSSGQKEDIVKNDLERTKLVQYIDFYAGIKPEEPDYKKGEPHFRNVAKHLGISFEEFIRGAIFIGDTLVDIDIAKNLGVTSIARKGTISKEKLIKEGADFVVNDFSSLPLILQNL